MFCSTMPQDSHFLRLPGELRNKIYEYVLTVPCVAQYSYIFFNFIINPPLADRAPLPTSILCTCRQIYDEAHLLPLHFDGFLAFRCYINRLSKVQLSALNGISIAMSTQGDSYIHRALPPAPFSLERLTIYIGQRQPPDYDCQRIATYVLGAVRQVTINFNPPTAVYSADELYLGEKNAIYITCPQKVKVTRWTGDRMSQLVMFNLART